VPGIPDVQTSRVLPSRLDYEVYEALWLQGITDFLFIDGKAVIFRFEGSLGEPSAETGKDPDP